MGNIIKLSSLDMNQVGLLKPIIYCKYNDDMYLQATSINIKLADKLSKYSEHRRTLYLEKCFNEVINELNDNPIIKDFDILFNPIYKTDILKLLISSYRKKEFSIIWCGDYIDGKLLYSKEELLDYKIYDISIYDITCVI